MSKVVKKVTRAISKVVKGVVNAVKKVASSKLGKLVLTAAAVYFGGAALSGALSSTAGSSALTGISNAWTSLSTAGSQALAGNFANAGSALSAGFQGGAATMEAGKLVTAGMGGVSPTAATLPTASTAPAATTPLQDALAKEGLVKGAPQMSVAGAPSVAPAASGYAPIADAMKTATYVQAGMTGAQMAMNAKAGSEAEKEQQAARDRYNENVGTNWWGSTGSTGSTGDTGATSAVYTRHTPTGLVAGAMTPEQQYAEQMRQQMLTYNPYALPTRV